jgi:hypothetical protein
MVLPGSAQLLAGSRRLGHLGLRLWLTLWAAAVLWGVAFLFDRSLALGLVGRAWILAVVEWVLLAYAVLWAALFADAWRLARPRRLSVDTRRLLAAVTVVVMVLACGATAWASRSVAAARAAVSAVFAGTTTVEPTDGRYNILLLGADTGKDRVGTRPDSIQLVSVDAETGRAVSFGFSRDTENITFRHGSVMRRLMPDGWNCGDSCLLNGLYTWAADHPTQFPTSVRNPGVLATEEAVEALSGLDVHYFVMVDLTGFALVRPLPRGFDQLRAHGAPAVRDDRHARAARPAVGTAAVPDDRLRQFRSAPDRRPPVRARLLRRPCAQGSLAEDPWRQLRPSPDEAMGLPGQLRD